MENYKLYKIDNKEILWYVVGLNYKPILESLASIQAAISEDPNYSHYLLVDQLLSAGNGRNRFIKCIINNGIIQLCSAESVCPSDFYRKVTSDMLRENSETLQSGILTDRQIQLIMKGGTI